MNTDWNELIHRYIAGQTTDEETRHLEASLKADDKLADLYLRHIELEVALETHASSAQITRELLSAPAEAVTRRSTNWYAWRPLTAAAAGIVFGMLCTSVVFGFVNQQAAVKKVPLLAFDVGLEDVTQTLKDGLPDRLGQWGMDEASIVAAEENVLPLQGERMLRLEPIPPQKPVKNHTSRAYQMLDLRSQPVAMMNGEVEAEVTASFCATNSDLSSRYLIRAIALDEEPETATKNFWSKVESDGVVSESQRFDTLPGKSGWHTFSMKLRLPPGSKTLVLIFGAVPPEDTSRPALVHYLDDVQVSLLTPQPLP
jgi:hypothetical protein